MSATEDTGEGREVELTVELTEGGGFDALKEGMNEYNGKMDAFNGSPASSRSLSPSPRVSKMEAANSELTSIMSYKSDTPWYIELKNGQSPVRFESPILGVYDILQFVLLSYTALVAPYEVAFVADPPMDGWWWTNRVVDTFFIMDLCFNFIRPTDTGNRARKLDRIRHDYVAFWFWVDTISSIPYDMIGNSKMKSFRLIRLMRLAKLGKLIRASRMVEAYEDRMSIPLSRLESYKLMVLVLITCHWMACFWCLIPLTLAGDKDDSELEDDPTWISSLEESKGMNLNTNFQIYVASLYFSVMTLTSVGYGDITPQSEAEYIGCIFLMLVSGIVWAYILGTLTAILSSMDPRSTHFKQTLDDLNFMIREEGMNGDTAARIRRYWREVQTVNRLKEYRPLIEKMSNGLQSELEHCICRRQFANVDNYEGMSDEFMAELAQLITQCKALYPPGERIFTRPKLDNSGGMEPVGRSLCVIMNKGLVGYGGRLIGRKCQKFHWGDDYLLECENLRVLLPATALSYVEVQFVPVEAIHFLLGTDSCLRSIEKHATDAFPRELASIRRSRIKLALTRGLVKLATLIKRMEADGQMGDMTIFEALDTVGPILKTVGAVDVWEAICAVGMGAHIQQSKMEIERRQKVRAGIALIDDHTRDPSPGAPVPYARASTGSSVPDSPFISDEPLGRRATLGGFAEFRRGGGDINGGNIKDLTMMVSKLLESQNEIKQEMAQMREDVNALKPDNGYHPSTPTVNALGALASPL